MRKRKGRFLSLLLVLLMVVGMLPLSVFAKDVEGQDIKGTGKRTVNRYLKEYSPKHFPDEYRLRFDSSRTQLNETNYWITLDNTGETYVAFCFNKNFKDPHQGRYVKKYEDATEEEFRKLASGPIQGNFREYVLWAVYLGYPCKNGKFEERATQFYHIPPEYAEDAVHAATQMAIWYFTDHYTAREKYWGEIKGSGKDASLGRFDYTRMNPLDTYQESLGDPLTYLAADIIRAAIKKSDSKQDLDFDMDLYKPTQQTRRQNLLVMKYTEHGSLKISKKVEGNGADPEKTFRFTVVLQNKDGEILKGKYGQYDFANGSIQVDVSEKVPVVIEHIPAGTKYTVKEEPVDGWKADQEERSGDITAYREADAHFVNTYSNKDGSLIISKTVNGDGVDQNQVFEFTVTLTNPDGVTPLPDGSYGDVTLKDGNGTASIQIHPNESIAIKNLPMGTKYTVTEKPVDGWKAERDTFTGEITVGQDAKADFVNVKVHDKVDEPGTLTIKKEIVDGANTASAQQFDFKVTLKQSGQPFQGSCKVKNGDGTEADQTIADGVLDVVLTGGSSVTIKGLPADVDYQVEEKADGLYTAVAATNLGNGYILESVENATGTIGNGKNNVIFRNKKEDRPETPETPSSAELILRKQVVGDALPDELFTFDIALADKTFSGAPSGVNFTDGHATVQMKAGEEKRITGLPVCNFTVSEQQADGWEIQQPQAGVLDKDLPQTIVFTNSKTTPDKPKQPEPKEPEQPEQPKPKEPEQPEPEKPKPEQPEPEKPKPEEPRPEKPKPEEPKPEKPKPEEPKPERPEPKQPKPEQPKAPEMISVTAMKDWKLDDGGEATASVTAVLMKDGVAWETAELNAANGWSHTWNNLSGDAVWTVEEKYVPEGFTSSVTRNGRTFVITNDDRPKAPVSVKVTKQWITNDGGVAATSATVVLLKNGMVEDTVVLRKENNWTYNWTGLDGNYTWTVDEQDVPTGFQRSIIEENGVFTIINDDVPVVTDVTDSVIYHKNDSIVSDISDSIAHDDADTVVLNVPNSTSNPDVAKVPVPMSETLDSVPQTGDHNHILMWFMMSFIFTSAGLVFLVFRKKRS